MKSHFLRRFVSGLLLFIPVFALGFGLAKFHGIIQKLAEPFLGFADPASPVGAVLLKLVAVLLVALMIYLLGYVADLSFISKRVKRLDRALHSIVPGYAMAKGIVGGVVKEDTMMDGFRPVLVPYDLGRRLGYEVERTEAGLVVVFLPNAPAARSGFSMVFTADQVERLDIPPHKGGEIMSFLGRGLGQEIEKSAQDEPAP